MKMHEVVLITIFSFIVLFIRIAVATEPPSINYGDCSYIKFEDVDPLELTHQEQIDLLNADLFTSLDKSEKCMQKAAANSAGKIGVLGAGNNQVTSTANTGNTGEAVDGPPPIQTSSTSSTTSSRTDSKRGAKTAGSSAVCDAVNQGLAGATTDSEKEHFKSLENQYGCK